MGNEVSKEFMSWFQSMIGPGGLNSSTQGYTISEFSNNKNFNYIASP